MNRFFSVYFRKIFIHTVIFGILPAMIIGMSLFLYLHQKFIRDIIPDSMANSLTQMKSRIEQNMQMHERQLLFLTSDREISSLMDFDYPLYNNFQVVNSVYNKLHSLIIYDLGTIDYCIINPKKNWMLSSLGVTSLGISSPRDRSIREYLERTISSDFPSMWHADYEEKDSLYIEKSFFWIQPKTVKCIYSFHDRDGQKSYISTAISASWYSSQFASDMSAENILMIDRNNRIVASKYESLNGLYLADSPYEELEGELKGLDSGFIKKTRSGYIYTFSEISFSGWTLIYILNIANALKELYFLRNVSILFGVILVISVIIFAFFRARVIYRPIKIELEDQTVRQFQLSRELFVHYLINGYISEIALEEKIKFYQFPECPPCCRVVLIQAEFSDDTIHEQYGRELLHVSLIDIASKVMAEFLCFPVITDGNNIIMISGANTDEKEFKRNLTEKLENIREKIYNDIHLDTVICISTNVSKYSMTYMHRFQAGEMFKFHFRYRQNSIIFVEDLEQAPVVYSPYPQNLEDTLHVAIRKGDGKEADFLLSQFIRYTLETEGLRQRCYLTFSRLLIGILRLGQEYLPEENYQGSWGIAFEYLFTIKSEKQIFEWIRTTYISHLTDHIHLSVLQKETVIIQKMKDSVKTRYTEYLSAEILSKELLYSPGYLRQVFKSGTGITFNEYLNNYRVDMAKELLVETNMHIKDIGKKLTYQNSQSFIKTFHKEIGMTPGDYRKIYGHKENPPKK